MARPRILVPEEAKRRDKEQKKAWKKANPEKIRQERLARYWRNRDKVRAKMRVIEATPEYKQKAHARRIKREFGLTPEQYTSKLTEQNGVCTICHRPCATHRQLSVDHNHQTGQVRGLLCVKCNTMLGVADDSVERLLNAVQYLDFWSKQ